MLPGRGVLLDYGFVSLATRTAHGRACERAVGIEWTVTRYSRVVELVFSARACARPACEGSAASTKVAQLFANDSAVTPGTPTTDALASLQAMAYASLAV